MKIQYRTHNFKPKSLELIERANYVIQEFEADGYTVTLRQLYYQFVRRLWIENTMENYKSFGAMITKGRYAGMISWKAMEDRIRNIKEYNFWDDDQALIDVLADQIKFDLWADQDHYVECWVEKDALVQVIARACRPLQVPYLCCRGYMSASEAWARGQKMKAMTEEGKQCVIIHVGDHDPSGIDMTRDNQDRLNEFIGLDDFSASAGIDMRRVALNMDQIDKHDLPPAPAKKSDSRSEEYIEQYGDNSWELDALLPKDLVKLITDAIKPLIDWDLWHQHDDEEAKMKDDLEILAGAWSEIKRSFSYD